MTLRDHLRPSAIVDASALGATARSAAEGLSRAAISGVSRVGSHIGVDPDVVPRPQGGLPPEELTAAHWGNGSLLGGLNTKKVSMSFRNLLTLFRHRPR